MTVDGLAEEVSAKAHERAKRQAKISLVVKIFFITLGSVVAGFAQFTQFDASGPNFWHFAGMTASVMAGLGGLYVVWTDQDAATELDLARRALEAARNLKAKFSETVEVYDALKRDLRRSVELYVAVMDMRGVLEQAVASSVRNPLRIVETLLTVAKRPLSIALGFELTDRWTLCVYVAETNQHTGEIVLRCAAHHRAIECEVTQARAWPSGVGVAGICFADARPIVLPDLLDHALGDLFDLSLPEGQMIEAVAWAAFFISGRRQRARSRRRRHRDGSKGGSSEPPFTFERAMAIAAAKLKWPSGDKSCLAEVSGRTPVRGFGTCRVAGFGRQSRHALFVERSPAFGLDEAGLRSPEGRI